jgi:hypothetical protein
MPGAATSEVEVTNISQHGFWLLLDGRELFLPFDEFPWFTRNGAGDPAGRAAGARASSLARPRRRPRSRLDRATRALPAQVEALTERPGRWNTRPHLANPGWLAASFTWRVAAEQASDRSSHTRLFWTNPIVRYRTDLA